MADLKTNYVDDVLDTNKNTKRKYNMIQNSDGTVSFEDVTEYLQVGDDFGSVDVNSITTNVNSIGTRLGGLSFVLMTQAQYNALTSKDSNTIYFTTA